MDTSVIGGCFDEEFRSASQALFDRARAGELILLVSTEVMKELTGAPDEVRQILDLVPRTSIEYLTSTDEIQALRDAYVAAGVVGPRSLVDATHVAYAPVARADAIVSWSFRHILRLNWIKGYHRANWENGYGVLTIVSPHALGRHEAEGEKEV